MKKIIGQPEGHWEMCLQPRHFTVCTIITRLCLIQWTAGMVASANDGPAYFLNICNRLSMFFCDETIMLHASR